MDPFSLALFAGGAALSLFSSNNEKERQQEQIQKMQALEKEKAGLTIAQNEAAAARATRDAIRRAQTARGLAVNYGGNSGSMDSSGLAGGLAQISNQEALTTSNISQNLDNSKNMIGINTRMSSLNAQGQIDSADNNFMAGIGSILMSNATKLGSIGQTAFGGLDRAGTNAFNQFSDRGMGSWSPVSL